MPPPEVEVHGGHVGPRVERHLPNQLVQTGERVLAGRARGVAVTARAVAAGSAAAAAELGVQAEEAGGAVGAALEY